MESEVRDAGKRRHAWVDDAQGFVTAILLISMGLAITRSAGLLTGGMPGLAFLVSYGVGLPLGWALILVNLPFCAFAWRMLGPRFTLRTLGVLVGVALGVEAMHRFVSVQVTQPVFAAVLGGLLVGVGLLVLFRHRASLGGFGALALHLQRRYGVSTGMVQMLLDAAVVLAALAFTEPVRVGYSVIGAITVNLVLHWNHRVPREPAMRAID
jgi:uncharacterized membrane-anchored protein YitT (DUF2179 family)